MSTPEDLLAQRAEIQGILDWLEEAPEEFWIRIAAQRDAATRATLTETDVVSICTSRGKILAYNWVLDSRTRLLMEYASLTDRVRGAAEGSESAADEEES